MKFLWIVITPEVRILFIHGPRQMKMCLIAEEHKYIDRQVVTHASHAFAFSEFLHYSSDVSFMNESLPVCILNIRS